MSRINWVLSFCLMLIAGTPQAFAKSVIESPIKPAARHYLADRVTGEICEVRGQLPGLTGAAVSAAPALEDADHHLAVDLFNAQPVIRPCDRQRADLAHELAQGFANQGRYAALGLVIKGLAIYYGVCTVSNAMMLGSDAKGGIPVVGTIGELSSFTVCVPVTYTNLMLLRLGLHLTRPM